MRAILFCCLLYPPVIWGVIKLFISGLLQTADEWIYGLSYLVWAISIVGLVFLLGWQKFKSWTVRLLAIDAGWCLILAPIFIISGNVSVIILLLSSQVIILPWALVAMVIMWLIERKLNVKSIPTKHQ